MPVIWREATPADWDGIVACHRQLEEKVGHSLDLPALDAPSILFWMVAERDGSIVQFFTLEKLVEMRMGGFDREALDELIPLAPAVFETTRRAGARWLHCPVPPLVAHAIGRELSKAGVNRSPNILFSADLR